MISQEGSGYPTLTELSLTNHYTNTHENACLTYPLLPSLTYPLHPSPLFPPPLTPTSHISNYFTLSPSSPPPPYPLLLYPPYSLLFILSLPPILPFGAIVACLSSSSSVSWHKIEGSVCWSNDPRWLSHLNHCGTNNRLYYPRVAPLVNDTLMDGWKREGRERETR